MCGLGKAAADRNPFPTFQDEVRAVKILCVFHVDKDAPAAQEEPPVCKGGGKFPESQACHNLPAGCAVYVDLVLVMLRIQNILKAEPDNAAYMEAPQEPPRQTRRRQQQAAEAAPDFDPTVCTECGKKCTNGVVKYSNEQYGRTLCMDCQRQMGGNQ